jgi:hypothetical protein
MQMSNLKKLAEEMQAWVIDNDFDEEKMKEYFLQVLERVQKETLEAREPEWAATAHDLPERSQVREAPCPHCQGDRRTCKCEC